MRMDVRFRDGDYERLERDPTHSGGFDGAIVRPYRNRMHLIRQAVDERDLRAFKSWRFEKLKGARVHQYSIRLNDQWRLILEIEGDAPRKVIVVIRIEDYY
jgi:proteic killer suppression protein